MKDLSNRHFLGKSDRTLELLMGRQVLVYVVVQVTETIKLKINLQLQNILSNLWNSNIKLSTMPAIIVATTAKRTVEYRLWNTPSKLPLVDACLPYMFQYYIPI